MFKLDEYLHRKLKKSTFGHFFAKGDTACAYNALKMETVYFPNRLLPFIRAVTAETLRNVLRTVPSELAGQFHAVLSRVCAAHVLVPVEYDELAYLERVKKQIFHGPGVRVMVLHLTDHCNLRCRYCFIEGGMPVSYLRRNMTPAVAIAAIDRFEKIAKFSSDGKRPSVVFYGGEPLLNWRVVKIALAEIGKREAAGRIVLDKVLITNGTLITPEIAAELKRCRVKVSVSIDGPKEINDLNRVFGSGKGSFDRVMQGIRCLRQAGISPTVSCVLGKDSLVHAQQIIHWLVEELGVRALGINHVSIVPNVTDYDPDYEARFGDSLIDIQMTIQRKYPDVYERRMNHKINAFLDRRILRADCTGCGEQMSVSPDGFIGICQGYMGNRKTFDANVTNTSFDPTTDQTFIEWSRRSPLNMKECHGCPALATCGGGCPRNADAINGTIWSKDSAFCHFAIKAQEWMIWGKYATRKNGGR